MGQNANYDSLAQVFDFFRAGDLRRRGSRQTRHFSQMQGSVLHVGIGTGMEIGQFPAGKNIIAIDLSLKMLERARHRASNYDGKINLCLMNTERLGFPDQCFDTISAVCVFCSVENPVAGLKELHRVLKPGGKLLLFEHVLSKNPLYGLSLRFMSLFTSALEGTHLDRNTVENTRKAGFKIESEPTSIWISSKPWSPPADLCFLMAGAQL